MNADSEINFSGIRSRDNATLKVGQSGVIIAPVMEIRAENYPFYVLANPPAIYPIAEVRLPTSKLSRVEVYQSLMFWDRIATPVVPMPISGLTLGTKLTSEDLILFENGNLDIYEFGFSGWVDEIVGNGDEIYHSGSTAGLVLDAFRQTFAVCGAREPGRWTLSTSLTSVPSLVADPSISGIVLELTNAIPLVTNVPDIETYLRFLEDRKDERRRLMATLQAIASDISESERPADALRDQVMGLKQVCADLATVVAEKKFSVTFGKTSFSMAGALDLRSGFQGFLSGAGAAASFGLEPLVGGSLGALLSHIQVSKGDTVRKSSSTKVPFAVVNRLIYPPKE